MQERYLNHSPRSTESQGPPTGLDVDVPIVLDIPLGCGRERVAAMIEAVTGRSLLGPCDPRAWRQERARRVAEARAALGIAPARRPRKPSIAALVKQAEKTGKTVTSITTPDGTTLTFGKPHADVVTPLEQWRKRRGQS